MPRLRRQGEAECTGHDAVRVKLGVSCRLATAEEVVNRLLGFEAKLQQIAVFVGIDASRREKCDAAVKRGIRHGVTGEFSKRAAVAA